MPMPLILASASAARADLLRAAGIKFRLAPAHVAEPPPALGEPLQHYLERLAQMKARAAAPRHPGAAVLAADTVLCLPARRANQTRLRIIGKPAGQTPAARAASAARLLRELEGREHLIGTGVCVLGPADARGRRAMRCGYAAARVRLRDLTPPEIRHYVAQVKPWHCAGAYALQGAGAAIIAEVRGDPTTIIGLPMALTIRLLLATQGRR